MSQQLSEVGRWISAVFYGTIAKVLPYVNGFVMAIKELIKAFALFVGYQMPDSSGDTGTILDQISDEYDDIDDGVDSVNDGLDDAIDKTKEWKNYLNSFDVANIQPAPTEDSDSSSSSAGAAADIVDPRILAALEDYDYIFGNVRMKANDIRDAILKWTETLKSGIKSNIFEPISNSWNRYGQSILQNAQQSFENLKSLASGMFDVAAAKWKSFFQSATDLFFSIWDTASIVSKNVTQALLDVWNNGGNRLFASLWDLATAFLEIAKNVNDKFVKPLIDALSSTLLPVIAKVVGKALGYIGDIITGISKVLAWISESTVAVTLLGSAFTAMFLTVKISKFVSLISSLKETIELYGGLRETITKVISKFTDNCGAIAGVKTALSTLNNVLKNTSVWSTFATYLTNAGTKLTNISNLSVGLTSTIYAKLGTAFTWLANHPLVIAIGAITALIAAFVALNRSQKETATSMEETAVSIEDCSEEVQKQAEAVQELTDSISSANDTYADTIANAQANADAVSGYITALKEMGDESGYVDNIGQAQVLIDKINEILPDTVQLSEDNRLEWLKTPDAIKEATQALLDNAEVEAKSALYVENIKQKIELQQQYADITDSINEKVAENAELERQATEGTISWTEAMEKITQNNTDLEMLTSLQSDLSDEIESTSENINELADSFSGTRNEAKKFGEATEELYDSLELPNSVRNSFDDLAQTVIDSTKTIESCAGKTTDASKRATDNAQKDIDRSIKSYVDLAVQYKLTYSQMVNIMQTQGIKLSAENEKIAQDAYNTAVQSSQDLTTIKQQQNTQLMALLKKFGIDSKSEDAKRYAQELADAQANGTEAGKAYISNLTKQLSDPSGKTTAAAKTTASNLKTTFENNLKNISVKLGNVSGVSNIVQGIQNMLSNTVFTLNTKMKLSGSDKYITASGTTVQIMASGGFPSAGQMFIAREAGPELVGKIGHQTTVMNNDQIVSSVAEGVYEAVKSAMAGSSSQGGDLYLTIQNSDGTTTTKIIRDYKKYMNHTGGKGGFPV